MESIKINTDKEIANVEDVILQRTTTATNLKIFHLINIKIHIKVYVNVVVS